MDAAIAGYERIIFIMRQSRKIIFEKEDNNGRLLLWEHIMDGKKEYELMINGVFLMASYNSLSSELLVKNAIDKLNIKNGSLLIGGLGLGYSVKEACLHGDKINRITVIELNSDVIECNLTVLHGLNGKYLSDRRVKLVNGDFIKYMNFTDDKYDIICMDIDNGPMLIVNESNKDAYSASFFKRVSEALNTKGVFVIWSCNEDDQLLTDMQRIFKKCCVEEVYEQHNGKNVPYYLYFAFV